MDQVAVIFWYAFAVGGGGSLLLFATTSLLTSFWTLPAARYLALFLTCCLALLLRSAVPSQWTSVHYAMQGIGVFAAGAFWLFAQCWCQQHKAFPKFGWLLIGVDIVLSTATFVRNNLGADSGGVEPNFILTLSHLSTGVVFACGLVELVRDFASDFDERRRRVRSGALIVIAIYLLAQVFLAAAYAGKTLPISVVMGQSLGVWVVALLICYAMFGPRALSFTQNQVPVEPEQNNLEITWDPKVSERLADAIAAGALGTPGLSVKSLAAQLSCSAPSLRRVINGQLGYRNFNAFVNQYRVEEAARLLADPANKEQILDIALRVGFGSLSPFNLAFKTHFQMTPSEYRQPGDPAAHNKTA